MNEWKYMIILILRGYRYDLGAVKKRDPRIRPHKMSRFGGGVLSLMLRRQILLVKREFKSSKSSEAATQMMGFE
jgi:hypothetical protein